MKTSAVARKREPSLGPATAHASSPCEALAKPPAGTRAACHAAFLLLRAPPGTGWPRDTSRSACLAASS
eukprot:9483358-Pyramimonas_sp.AAC.1